MQVRSASSVGLARDLMDIAGYCESAQVRAVGAGDVLVNGTYRSDLMHARVCETAQVREVGA